jgi:FAD:protein FMN transferase
MQRFGLIGVPAGLRLDLGATAKAWTADRAATTIAGRYGCAVLVEIGGDLRAAGRTDRPWLVEVAERAGDPAVLVSLRHGGLTTSTRTVRQWPTPSGEAHHVIDPCTGLPSNGPWRTASVWAPSAVRANTFSTAVVATGETAEARLRLAGHPARLVAKDGTVRELGGWPSDRRAA